jgi:protein-disulfide isomerase
MTTYLTPPVGPRDHVFGSARARVTLVEYGDYECPYCGATYPLVKSIIRRLGPDLLFVFRNFPLWEMHENALLAAEAAEAAAAQGVFWEMHDQLFSNQSDLSSGALVRYAAAVVPDPMRWASDMQMGSLKARVQQDRASGDRSGVHGTPTFFVNGFRHDGGLDEASLLMALETAIESRTLGA